MKIYNPLKWLEFKKESIIIFANLKRNSKAYKSLSEYTNTIALIFYIIGLVVFALIYQLLFWIF